MRQVVGRQFRLSLALAASGWLLFLVAGPTALLLIFGIGDAELFRNTAVMLAGAGLLAAVEPITRMMLGLRRLGSLVVTRILMLVVAILAAQCSPSLAMLDRFSISLAIGYAVAAAVTIELGRREGWGRVPA